MSFVQGFRFALRSLHSRSGTAAAIAISCVIDAVQVRALPYPLTALAAWLLPAQRAARSAPLDALRYE